MTSDRESLIAGDHGPLGMTLGNVLTELVSSGFRVWDVHESTDGRYEVLLDREIDEKTAQLLAAADGLLVFADFDENDCQRGYGILCQQTGHHVNGPVSDGTGHS